MSKMPVIRDVHLLGRGGGIFQISGSQKKNQYSQFGGGGFQILVLYLDLGLFVCFPQDSNISQLHYSIWGNITEGWRGCFRRREEEETTWQASTEPQEDSDAQLKQRGGGSSYESLKTLAPIFPVTPKSFWDFSGPISQYPRKSWMPSGHPNISGKYQ